MTTQRQMLRARATAVAARCEDAYSFDRYRSWIAVAEALLAHGYSEREAEAIMRSKITRWAADQHIRYDGAPARLVLPLAERYFPPYGPELRVLVANTFVDESGEG